MSDNSHLSREEIRRRINQRNASGKPIGRLVSELRSRNNANHAHMSDSAIYQRIADRKRQGKPTGQLRRVLRDRGHPIDWQTGP